MIVGVNCQTSSVQHPPPPPPLENSFLSAARLSPTMHEAKDGARRSEFPLKLPASSAGNNSVASTAAAAAAASVRETLRDAERGSVCESQCVWESVCERKREREREGGREPEWARVPMHCAERGWADPSRGKLCVPPSGSRALWWAYRKKGGWGEGGRVDVASPRSSSISEDQHPAGASQSTMVGLESHCWHRRDWWWQPTHGLPCATAAPHEEEAQPCESDSAAGNSWTCFPGQSLDFFLCLNLFF